MTIGIHKQSVHGPELRAIVLDSIPSLRDAIGVEHQDDPHRIMRALFDHASQVVRDGDVPSVICCFALAKKLLSLDRECDIYVRSSIWTSFWNRFHQNDVQGLAIFREIAPSVRETISCPFTFPHTWFREMKLVLPGAASWCSWLTVDRKVEAEARMIKQTSSRDKFAIVRLQLEPSLDERAVVVRNRIDDTKDVPLWIIEAIIEGVTNEIVTRCSANRGI